jgi:hypothetical protein
MPIHAESDVVLGSWPMGITHLRQPDHLGGDADAPLIQALDRNLVPIADGAYDVLFRDLHTLRRTLHGTARHGTASAPHCTAPQRSALPAHNV